MLGPERVNSTAFTGICGKQNRRRSRDKPKNNLKKYSYSRQHLSTYSILSIYLKP